MSDSLAYESVDRHLKGRFGRPYTYVDECESTQLLLKEHLRGCRRSPATFRLRVAAGTAARGERPRGPRFSARSPSIRHPNAKRPS